MANWARGALALLAACAPIHTREIAVDTALASKLQRETVADSVAYNVVPAVQGDVLVLAISEAERCDEIEVPRKHRTTHFERHADRTVMSSLWVVGGLFTVAGAIGYFDADRVAASQIQSGMTTTPAEVRNSGIVGMALGGMALLSVAGNYFRAIDRERDDGVLSDPPIHRQYACNQGPTREARVTLDLGGATVRGDTDNEGRAAFNLTDVPGDALPQRGRPFGVVIGNRRASVGLADNEVAALRRTLAANPASRLAQEEVAQCSSIFDSVDRLLSDDLNRDEATQIARALERTAALCTNPDQQARLRALNPKLAARMAAIGDEERRAARRAELEPQQQPQQQAPQPRPQQNTNMLRWACGGTPSKYAFGVLTCLAPVAGDLCANATEAGIKVVARKAINALLPSKLQGFATLVVDELVAKAGAQVIAAACTRWVNDQHLPRPSGNVLRCALSFSTWIDEQCRAVGSS